MMPHPRGSINPCSAGLIGHRRVPAMASASAGSAVTSGLLLQLLACSCLLPSGCLASSDADDDEFVWPPDDLVMPLDLTNFDALVGNGSAWVVEFYAPWCGLRMLSVAPPLTRSTPPTATT